MSVFNLLKYGTSVRKEINKEEFFDKNEKNLSKLYFENSSDIFEIKTIDEFNLNLNNPNNNKNFNIHKNILKEFIKNNKINFKGKYIKTPVFNFFQLNKIYDLDNKIIEFIVNELEFGFPSNIQSLVFPNFLENNGIYISPTGSGKTLAYLLPILNNFIKNQNDDKITVIILPVFELINQVYNTLKKFLEFFKFENCLSKLENEDFINTKFIITTPKKLLENKKIPKNKINRIILDEADRFFDLNFLDDIVEIFNQFDLKVCKFNLFSATLPIKIEELINTYLIDKIVITVNGKTHTINDIDQQLIYCSNEEAKMIEIENLINNTKFEVPCLIFVQNKARTYHLFKIFKKFNIACTFINSKLTKFQRLDRIKKFNEQKVLVLITTDVLGRGVDLKEINMVINFDIPSTPIDYIHRVGRTGRFGKKGKSVTLFTNQDKLAARSIANILKSSGFEVYD